MSGQGVSGLLVGAGLNPDLSQLKAQLLGGGVILAMGLLGGGLVFLSARTLFRDWRTAARERRAEEEE